MTPLAVVLIAASVLLCAYFTYGRLLGRLFRLDPTAPMPSEELRDGVDYEPTSPRYLLGQHLSAIAAAGPIVGPILAGVAFGWLPALLWIIVGSIFVGGVHDLGSLIASVRHRARSIAEVVRDHMSRRAHLLLLAFIYIALIYIIVAFTDIVASSFVGVQTLEDGSRVSGAGVASTSVMYLGVALALGLALRFGRVRLSIATLVALPLVGVTIWLGQRLPLDLAAWLDLDQRAATRLWGVLLLGYCLVAGAVPLWLLLQPRGHLGGWFMYLALFAGAGGLVIASLLGSATIQYPAFRGFHSLDGQPLMPILFITIACGACSGFHCLIASGTTSKQLRRESDAKLVGYGAMLTEGMIAVVSLACVMVLTVEATRGLQPNAIYARGVGGFVSVLGVPAALAVSFALLAFTTFVYDTLDVCTRLGRFIVQELTGLRGATGRWLGTAVTAGLPVAFLFTTPLGPDGLPVAAWRLFWPLFGASNQLLAALALMGVTIWLWRTRRALWVWLVLGVPTLFMYVVSTWALLRFIAEGFLAEGSAEQAPLLGALVLPTSAVPWIALLLVLLAAAVAMEAALAIWSPQHHHAARIPDAA
jgi:carbon starvation protein